MQQCLARFTQAAGLVLCLSIACAPVSVLAADYPETPAARAALERRAEAGDADAAFALAKWYRGEALVHNSVAAVEPMVRLYRQAAEAGNVEAMDELYGVQFFGNNDQVKARAQSLVSKDEAARWHRRAAEGGLAGAMYTLGVGLNQRGETPAEVAEGAEWLRRCAAQGHSLCMEEAAHAYRLGRGVDQDLAEALRLFERALDATSYPNPRTLHNAGVLLHQGVPGRPADEKAARVMLERAAQGGFSASMQSMANYHEHGLGGLTPSLTEALKWQREAAKKDSSPTVQQNIARLEAAIAAGNRTGAPRAANPAATARPAVPGAPTSAPDARQAGSARSTACNPVDGTKADAIAYAESLADVKTWQCTWETLVHNLIHPGPPAMVVEDGVFYTLNSRSKVAENLRLVRSYRSGINLIHEFSANCHPQFASSATPKSGTIGTVTISAGFVNNTSDRSVLSYPYINACGRQLRRSGAKYSEQPYPPT